MWVPPPSWSSRIACEVSVQGDRTAAAAAEGVTASSNQGNGLCLKQLE